MDTMIAAVVDHAGPAESFRIAELPVPDPGVGEVVIRQRYAAVNYGDVIRRQRGMFLPGANSPYILGFEGVGTVERLGPGTSHRRVGERVAYLAERGGYGTCVAVPAGQTWRVPPEVSDESAAAITCVGLTAWGLVAQSGVRSGDTALVHGAAGGVGSVLLQLLAAQGTRTIALVTGDAKREFVSALGADVIVNRATEDAADRIGQHAPHGVDTVFDCVGQDVLDLNLSSIRPGGVWMYYGSTSGHAQFPGKHVLMNHLALQGFVVFDVARDASMWRQGTAFLAASLTRGTVKPQTTQILPINQIARAHSLLESRSSMGKVLIAF